MAASASAGLKLASAYLASLTSLLARSSFSFLHCAAPKGRVISLMASYNISGREREKKYRSTKAHQRTTSSSRSPGLVFTTSVIARWKAFQAVAGSCVTGMKNLNAGANDGP